MFNVRTLLRVKVELTGPQMSNRAPYAAGLAPAPRRTGMITSMLYQKAGEHVGAICMSDGISISFSAPRLVQLVRGQPDS